MHSIYHLYHHPLVKREQACHQPHKRKLIYTLPYIIHEYFPQIPPNFIMIITLFNFMTYVSIVSMIIYSPRRWIPTCSLLKLFTQTLVRDIGKFLVMQ